MVHFENTVIIDRPPEQVFGYLADFARLSDWNPAVRATRKRSAGPPRVGTIYWQAREFAGRDIEDEFAITAYEPPARLAIESRSGAFPIAFDYQLAPVGGGTRLINRVRLEPAGLLGLAAPLLAPRVQTAVRDNLHRLKGILEEPA